MDCIEIDGKRVPRECLEHCSYSNIRKCEKKECGVYAAYFCEGYDLSNIFIVDKAGNA